MVRSLIDPFTRTQTQGEVENAPTNPMSKSPAVIIYQNSAVFLSRRRKSQISLRRTCHESHVLFVPVSGLVRFQWETRIADLNTGKVLSHFYRLDDSSIIHNVSKPKVSLFEIPNDAIHYAVPIFKSAPIKKKNLPFSQLDVERAWASNPSDKNSRLALYAGPGLAG